MEEDVRNIGVMKAEESIRTGELEKCLDGNKGTKGAFCDDGDYDEDDNDIF